MTQHSKLCGMYRDNKYFILQGCIQLFKSDRKDIYNVTKYFYVK